MLDLLKKQVCEGNISLVKHGLVLFTFGNLSAIDREKGIIAIKPSGVNYEELTPEKIVLVNLKGEVVEGELRPSSDTAIHLEIYKKFPNVGSIVHTHSTNATAFAQAKHSIKCLGTTHADYFFGDIPVIPELADEGLFSDYEKSCGQSITNYFLKNKLDPSQIQACLVASHGPFVWGKNVSSAIFHSVVLERLAEMNILTLGLNKNILPIRKELLEKHYLRKNGAKKYYGQITKNNS